MEVIKKVYPQPLPVGIFSGIAQCARSPNILGKGEETGASDA